MKLIISKVAIAALRDTKIVEYSLTDFTTIKVEMD